MRETLAKVAAAVITGLLVALAALFAQRRNAPILVTEVEPAGAGDSTPISAPPLSALDPSVVERGRAVYEEQSCARCHSLEGRGNPRAPLDGVGARRTSEELRAWITGTGSARGNLSGSAQRAKERFRELPESDLAALLAYLSTLR